MRKIINAGAAASIAPRNRTARRRLVAGIAFASMLLTLPVVEAPAADGAARVGVLGMDSRMQGRAVESLAAGLRSLGWIEGKNLAIEYRWAEGRFEELPKLAVELVAAKVDVIVTAAPPAVTAAKQATSTIPIVFLANDPVAFGYAQSLARPGGNMTGMAFQDADLSTRRLVYLRDAVPGFKRVAILSSRERNSGAVNPNVKGVELAATELGMEPRVFEVSDVAGIARAIAAARQWGAHGLIEMASPFFTLNRKRLIEALDAQRMPATCEWREYVVDGCLMSYSANRDAMFRQMAGMTDRILKGANPATMPIEQPREFEFVINKRTADAMGLTIPKAMQFQMTEPFL